MTDQQRSDINGVMSYLVGPSIDSSAPKLEVRLALTDAPTPSDAYRLSISERGVDISSDSYAGIAFGAQTLRQLAGHLAYRSGPLPEISLPFVEIDDSPALAWRGAHLDVARHFMPKRFLLAHIEALAAHKFNRLQLHLSDDQGWRVESAAFPRLTAVGAHRSTTQITHFDDPIETDGIPHGGYYSRDDLAEIVDFARARGIVVIPEIDLPGHTGAMIASYPHWGSAPGPSPVVRHEWGVLDSVFAPLPGNIQDLFVLLEEILEIFPSPWIHVGGDEVLLERWEADDRVVAQIQALGLSGTRELFAHFLASLESFLTERDRVMVTWDDAFANDPSSAPKAVVMAWRGEAVAQRAAQMGFLVINSDVSRTYFDYSQAEDPSEPLAIGGPLTIDDILSFVPVAREWTAEEQDKVLGTQFQLWTEFIPTAERAEYMTWPRACAFAEVAWTGGEIDHAEFFDRLQDHLPRLEAAGINYRPVDGPAPWQEGGTGARRFRPSRDLSETIQEHALAAERGDVAFTQGR